MSLQLIRNIFRQRREGKFGLKDKEGVEVTAQAQQ